MSGYDFSKYWWFFPLESKVDVYSTFVKFQCYVENILGNTIKIVRPNLRGEFTSNISFNLILSLMVFYNNLVVPIPLNKMVMLSANTDI